MYLGGDEFLRSAEELGVDYVFISDNERGSYEVNESWFSEHYPLIYDRDGIQIYQITEESPIE